METIFIEVLKDSPIAIALIICVRIFLKAMKERDTMFTNAIEANERALSSLSTAVPRLELTVEKIISQLDEGE